MALPGLRVFPTPPGGPGEVLRPVRSLDSPDLYLDRELSLLAFQQRVLDEARDSSNPLLERVKFLAIFYSNMDEFFMVRVGILYKKARSVQPGNVPQRLDRIQTEVELLWTWAYDVWREVRAALAEQRIAIRDYQDLNAVERRAAEHHFRRAIYPTLTPLAVDTAHPFPHISNLSLSVAVVIRGQHGQKQFARIKVPDALPQLVLLPGTGVAHSPPVYVWIEQLVLGNLSLLFPGAEILEAAPFRVTRDAEYEIQEVESDDLLETIEEAVRTRRFRDVVRLEVPRGIASDLLGVLLSNLELQQSHVLYGDGPLGLSRLRQLLSMDRPELKDRPFQPRIPEVFDMRANEDLWGSLRAGDVLLHHPYDSFQPVVDFLQRAAEDADVLAIKITLYRVGRNSPIVESLLRAIENGKQVAVLVELKARFDEESNIEWARLLESEGVHVVYGVVGLKVHSKVAMVVRREGAEIRRYLHLGTGNYNPVTSRLYTDLSFFTADEQIGEDVTELFNSMTGYPAPRQYQKLLVAPGTLRLRMEELIRTETQHVRQGERGHIILKMNSLDDANMIRLLYEASQAGVTVDLFVRGICCLRPGVDGVSSNIRVTSLVGRFLEHSRIFYFRNGGAEKIYLGSADLMGRNLDHRVEVLFPVENPQLISHLRDDILANCMADTRNARRMLSDGTYERHGGTVNSQERFLRQG